MEFELLEIQKLLKNKIKTFLDSEISKTYFEELEKSGDFPSEFLRKMGRSGLLGLPFPEEYGGQGGRLLEEVLIFEELASFRFSAAQAVGLVWLFGGKSISRFGTDKQKGLYIPRMISGDLKIAFAITEPDAGSDAFALNSKAEARSEGFVLNGHKTLISAAQASEKIIVVVRTGDGSTKKDGLSLFLIDTGSPGLTVNRLETMGRKTLGTCEIFFEDVFASQEDLLGRLHGGWDVIDALWQGERVCTSAMSLGAAQSVLEHTIEFARNHFRSGKPLAKSQNVRHTLADMAMRIEASRLLSYQAAWLISRHLPAAKQVCMAKILAAQAWKQAVQDSLDIMRDSGFIFDNEIQRQYRDASAASVAAGTSEVLKNMISRDLGL